MLSDNDESKETVQIVLKLAFTSRAPLIIKLRDENKIKNCVLEQQAAFSEHLRERGIRIARYYRSGSSFAVPYKINGCEIYVTVEDYQTGEIKIVNAEISEKIGRLLAQTHNVSEEDNCHVKNRVLFDPFSENELFHVIDFMKLRHLIDDKNIGQFDRICKKYYRRMEALSPLQYKKKYAVQGDISDCNLFMTEAGDIGLFDFNNCGDAVLFCDAIMQGVFLARLMDYDKDLTDEYSVTLFRSFLTGYCSVRPFTAIESKVIPHLYSIIDAFWAPQILYANNSLSKLVKANKILDVAELLEKIEKKIDNDIHV
jgi:Ser/Thr protein kinase RdoA (MazF antagonist)